MAEHAGNRWYKCDLHLHTMSSKCYLNKEDTASDWVKRALDQGLNAAAVTDHNDYRSIEAICEEGQKQGLAVFPGVEITCDSSKIHMLILFDTNKKAETVRDFLNRCDIDSEHIGDPDGTSLGVFEVCEIAKKRGAMVIAAHIDEFNSVNSMNPANLEKLFSGGYIDAVQVSNVPIWRKLKADKDMDAAQQVLQEKYGPDATMQEIDRWRKCYNRAEEMGLPMLCFSDNPAGPNVSKHGLWGIGSVYTWIQMDDVVNLESIRQSLFAPETRIRMMFDSESEPRTEPDFWIRSIEVRNSKLNPHAPVHLDFHPQLNCVIGGKGSGKSSIVRLLLGVYRQFPSALLKTTTAGENLFYTIAGEENRGIFQENSEIEIHFSWYKESCKLLITDIRNMDNQKITFLRLDPDTGEYIQTAGDKMMLSAFFCAQVFTERQIHEIIMTPGALLDYVDRCIYDMYLIKAQKEMFLEELVHISTQLHMSKMFFFGEDRIRSELKWFVSQQASENRAEIPGADLDSMIELRRNAVGLIESHRRELASLQDKRAHLLEQYESCFEKMRELRSRFIEEVLSSDINYKMELEPGASKDSFQRMIKETLQGDPMLIANDVKILENALFSQKDGVKKYTALLTEAREGNSEERTIAAETDNTDSPAENKPADKGQSSKDENSKANGKSVDGSVLVSGADSFSAYFIHLIRQMKDSDFVRMLLFRPEDELRMFYHPNGVKRFFPMTTASSGEKATAAFSFLLRSSNTPLVIDQPEDDMDNRVIYEEIVQKLKDAKQRRQMIIVTHNANITTNTDPEMIISMDSRSKFMKIRLQGSADNDDVRREICDVVEGTEQGFLQRARKYHL